MFTNVYSRSQSKKKAFTKSCTKWADDLGKKEIEKDLAQVILTVRLNDNRMNNMDLILMLNSQAVHTLTVILR